MYPIFTTSLILAAEAEESSGIDLLLPETSELIAGIVAFSIIFFFVWKWVFPALNTTLEARQDAIKGELTAAEESKAEAATLLADYQEQLKSVRQDADRIVDEARQSAESLKSDIVAKANTEAEDIVTKARTEADSEKQRALQEARSDVASLSIDLAEKVVGNSLDRDAQQHLVDAYLADLDRMA
jgi:F-type H+-transporting ATPase subunit b